MTNTFNTYEFTAFAVTDLGIGHRVNKGESFTMPGASTLCFEVTDNDKFLSGDKQCNENSDDGSGQHASILDENGAELGNGRQIYAESYHWVTDQHGNHYVMIEIEQEGSGVDYVSFYTGGGYSVPPEGAVLTVGNQCNVTSNWIDFACLDSGEKPMVDLWSFDDATCTYTIEAEAWDLHGFNAVDGNKASGGELVKITGHDGKLSTDFGGTDGVYNMIIHAQDESDGNSKLMVYVNGELQQTIKLNQNSDGVGSDHGDFSAVTLKGLEIAEGDNVEIRAWKDGGEWVRIDAIKFEQVKFAVCEDPDAVKLDFEEFATGAILGTQIDGVTISAMGGSGDAMIFDSQNPTGGDHDLETQVAQLGNVLIVSEDGDSSDPDDVVGGKLTFDFDNPSSVFDIKVIDTEEGGTITLTLADGSTQTFDIPNLVNGGVGQVVMDVDNVVRMEVQLDGSGAIDDLCYVPGAEPLGSLSGRYFFDADRDGLDNDAGNAIAGVTVTLLDENGDPVLDGGTPVTTVTGPDGTYSFGDLVAGTYGVKFTDTVDGRELTTQNADGDVSDDIDSDAGDIGGGMSTILGITVVAGENTPDNDAGVVEELGSLSGRYFCDDDRDGLDNDGTDNGVQGVTVALLDATGAPVLDATGAARTTTTDAMGNYSFAGLVAGTYAVLFADTVSGKELTAQNVDSDGSDGIDSDAFDLGGGLSRIDNIVVEAGANTPDNDAGVFPNESPVADDAMGKGCADEDIVVDLSGAFSDADSASVSITMLNGVAFADGDTNIIDGIEVTLTGDSFTFNGETAYADLLIGDTATQEFTYTVTDSDGASTMASIDVTFCGTLNTLDTIDASLAGVTVTYVVDDIVTVPGFAEAYTLQLQSSTLGDIALGTYTQAYCIDSAAPLELAVVTTATVSVATEANAVAAGVVNADKIDSVNWLLNNDFTLVDNGDGTGETYTDLEVQEAIWVLLNGDTFFINEAAFPFPELTDNENGVRDGVEIATLANVNEIAMAAMNLGDGFEAGAGEIVGLILDPIDPAEQEQPFIIGVEFDALAQDCIC